MSKLSQLAITVVVFIFFISFTFTQMRSNGWYRSNNHTFQFFAKSEFESIQYQMYLDNDLMNKKHIRLQIVELKSSLCLEDSLKNTSIVFYVDSREIIFSGHCSDLEALIMTPKNVEGHEKIVEAFSKSTWGKVRFANLHKEGDLIFHIPRKGFRSFYAELKSATRKAL